MDEMCATCMCCALKQTQWRFLEYSWLRFFPSCNLILAIFLTFHFEKEMYHKPATPDNSFFLLWGLKNWCVTKPRPHRDPPPSSLVCDIFIFQSSKQNTFHGPALATGQGGRVFWSNSFQSLKSTTIRLSTLITSSALWRVSKDWNSRSSFCRHSSR